MEPVNVDEEIEKIYDEEIAPQLLALARRCNALGISFLATVEYRPDCIARTDFQTEDCGLAQLLVHWAARCQGNVDRLFMTVDRYARKHGHSSVYLELAGNRNVRHGENEFAALAIQEKDKE